MMQPPEKRMRKNGDGSQKSLLPPPYRSGINILNHKVRIILLFSQLGFICIKFDSVSENILYFTVSM